MSSISKSLPTLPTDVWNVILNEVPKEILADKARVCNTWKDTIKNKYENETNYKAYKELKVKQLEIKKMEMYNEKLILERRKANRPKFSAYFKPMMKMAVAVPFLILTLPLMVVASIICGLFGKSLASLVGQASLGFAAGVIVGAFTGSLGSLVLFLDGRREFEEIKKKRRLPIS